MMRRQPCVKKVLGFGKLKATEDRENSISSIVYSDRTTIRNHLENGCLLLLWHCIYNGLYA